MWNTKKVEQALFQWEKWKRSIVLQWLDVDADWEALSLAQLRSLSKNELRALELMTCVRLEVYWICCVVSYYSLDDPSSYNGICVPDWLWSRYDELAKRFLLRLGNASDRSYPPAIWTEDEGIRGKDYDKIDFSTMSLYSPPDIESTASIPTNRQNRDDLGTVRAWEASDTISLFSNHELYTILMGLKGRPQERRKRRGVEAHYSDRKAVHCASLKDNKSMTDYEIAIKLNLPSKRYYESNQSDTVKHLVERGRRLIESVGLE